MELRHLHAFVAVAEELSFTRAAERLHISQPPLSQQIKRLEREVGTALLRRTTRSVELTAAGAAFLAGVRDALGSLDAAKEAAHRAAAGESGTVRLGFSGPTSYRELAAITREFRVKRPHVRLEVAGPFFAGELAGRLRLGELDAGLVRLPLPDAGLRVVELLRHPLAAAVPAGHPLAARDVLRLADLDGVPLVGYPSGRGSVVRKLLRITFAERGLTLEVAQEAPDTHTILSLVAAGAGVGLVPVSARHLGVPGVTLLPVADAPAVPLGLAWRDGDPDPAVRALVGLVQDLAGELPDAAAE
ncbi:LysR family transcriptional regulator [Streptomyces sp. Ru73]|uniref:LysR family transcriptional regulator n=1 Tax=Streptomyces sp. Ru73 TaxID=2080748 RepID=UPI000CDDA569|nr:LysR family transcriptional regulator [Streptomyces sp. Ru73]POX42581.1 LysR family transcriptional regulator [Streptomyces sp. Ru73]